jgi:arylformamidase
MVTFGGEETREFRRQSTDFLQVWRANGLQGELLVQEGKHHFSAFEGLNDADSPLCNAIIDFMVRCEKGQCPEVKGK